MEQQSESLMDGWKRKFNLAHALCVMHQRALTIIGRDQYGVEALALPCALALVLMVAWAVLSGDPYMWVWIALWFGFFLRRRNEARQLEKSGERIHSEYDGRPWDAMRLGVSEKVAKRAVEPILIGILGGLLYWIYDQNGLSPYGLPYFILAGVVTLPFVEIVKGAIWEKRIRTMTNARIESEQAVEAARNRWGNS